MRTAMQKITVENCTELCKGLGGYDDSTTAKAAAWHVVYEWCQQNGIGSVGKFTGIEQVINFLSQLKEKKVAIKTKPKNKRA